MLFIYDSCIFLKVLFSFLKGKESHSIFLYFLVDIQMKEVWNKVGSQCEICFWRLAWDCSPQQEHLCNRQLWIAALNQTESVFGEIMACVHADFHSELCVIQFHSMGHESHARMSYLKSSPCPLLRSMYLVCLLLFDQSLAFSQKKLMHDLKTAM